MADSDALRAKRARQHKAGDHELCTPRCPAKKLASFPTVQQAPVNDPTPPPPPTTPIYDQALAELTAAGVADTTLGQAMLNTAMLLDQSRAIVGRAPLLREFRDTRLAALAAKPVGNDEVEGLLLSIGDRLH